MPNPLRPDLGPRLRRVLAEQLLPPMHNIPVHSELGAQIRRGFMSPPPGRVFASLDYDQLEMRVLAQYAGIRPGVAKHLRQWQQRHQRSRRELDGTRKIADLPAVCRHREHNPPSMQVFTPGVYEHTCPGCGASQTFRVDGATF